MGLITRRKFIANASIVAANSVFLGISHNAFADATPHIDFPTAPRDRLAVASYSFRAYIIAPRNRDRDPKLPGMDLKDFAGEVVKKFNVHNIEPLSRHFSSLENDYLAQFREALRSANAKAVDIAVDGDQSFYDRDLAARKQAITHAREFVNVAVQIGCPSIRVHISRAKDSSPHVERTAESLRDVVGYASSKNVVVNLENDDLISEDAFFVVKVIESVNHPFLRALPDFANSMTSGNAEFNYRAVEAMFGHAYGICHVKDGEVDDKGKRFNIDMPKTFGILKATAYRGYCSMEFDAPGDPYAPTAALVDQTLRYLA
jgi:sugar phosphate isomerase/epimerase